MTADSPLSAPKQHAAFLKQSTWLMVANVMGGLLFTGVHVLSKSIPQSEYAIFGTMLMVITVLPTMPLQMMYAQQTASGLVLGRQRQLSGIIRGGLIWSAVVCVLAGVLLWLFQNQIASRWELNNPFTLWITLSTILMSVWIPILVGVMQGKQDFFWIGTAAVLIAMVRLGLAVGFVKMGGGAASMMVAALIAVIAANGVGLWRVRELVLLKPEPFDGKALWRKIAPLLCGFGVCQFMFAGDTMFAKAFFRGNEMGPYVAAGTMSRALLWLVLPLAAVMFPKVVQSSTKSEKSNLLGIVLLGSAVLAVVSGLCLCIVARVMPGLVQIVFPASYISVITALLPWYVGAMIPLALANVLINDLMARGRFRVVPIMVAIALAYAFTLPYVLNHYSRKFETVLQTLGGFNLLLLVVCAWAAFGGAKSKNPTPAPAA